MTLQVVHSERREAFWTLVVGAPAVLSILRLWVESGGELQTTLLLVSHVGPLNLGAALFAAATQLVTVVLVVLFAAGGVLRASVNAAAPGSSLAEAPPLVARAATATPPWFVVSTFVLALLSWKIFYLPLLIPAAVATSQRPLWRIHQPRIRTPMNLKASSPPAPTGQHWAVPLAVCLTALAGYGWLVGPGIGQAWRNDETVILLLLAVPPVIAFGMSGPLPAWFARGFAAVAHVAILVLAGLAIRSAVESPILPLVVSEVRTDVGSEYLRGRVVSVDDVYVVMLLENDGVRYIPTEDITSTVLCGTPEELPAFSTRVRDFHVEDSLLTAMGRHVRPRVDIDPLCRISPSTQS